jgi:hypothetical protein
MKAKDCLECAHLYRLFKADINVYCAKGHKPRFYHPRNELDQDWGWKRRCDDFAPKSDVSATDALESRLPVEG